MTSLIANSVASPGALLPVSAVSRQTKSIKHCSLRCSSLRADNNSLKFCSLSTYLSDGRRMISLSSQRSASVICAAALNARWLWLVEQTQTVTRQSSTIHVAPIQVSAPGYKQEWKCWKVLDYGLNCKVNCACMIKVTEDWMQIKLDMPGLSFEDIKVSFEGPTKSIVRVIGQGKESPEADVGFARQYMAVFAFKMGESEFFIEDYQTEMDNGLLRLRIPRVKGFKYRWGNFLAKTKNCKYLPKEPNTTGNGEISCTFPIRAATTEEQKKIMGLFKIEFLPSDESDCLRFVHVNEYCRWEDEDKLVMWFDMPGLEPTHFQIAVCGDTMTIKGEGIESPVDDDQRIRRHASLFSLPQEEYDLDAYKKEMKNGVLKVEVPKVKRMQQECVQCLN